MIGVCLLLLNDMGDNHHDWRLGMIMYDIHSGLSDQGTARILRVSLSSLSLWNCLF